MSLAPCRFSTKAGVDVNAGQKEKRKVLLKSEQQIRAELEGTLFVSTRYLSKVAGGHAGTGISGLRVVEGVEGLRPELQPGVLAEFERFEHRDVPVVASATTSFRAALPHWRGLGLVNDDVLNH
jgi:hypothetical protein